MSSYHLPGGGRRRGLLNPLSLPTDHGPTRSRAAILKLVLAIAVLGTLACAGAALGYTTRLGEMIGFGDAAAKPIQAQLSRASGQPYNLLVIGVDATSAAAPHRAGIAVLLHEDPTQGRAWLLWIPPTVLQPTPGLGTLTVADARLHGGAADTIRVVKALTGLKIQQYAEVDLGAIHTVVDTVGGVWVDAPASIEDTQADSSPQQNASRILAGPQLLDGYHSLTFARALTSAQDRGYGRMADQQRLLHAIAGAIAERAGSPAMLGVLAAAAPSLKTTLGLSGLSDLETQLRTAGSSRIYEATLTGTSGGKSLVPDPTTLARLGREIRTGVPFDLPTAGLPKAAAKDTTVVATKAPSQVTVTVSNGGGISGAAKQAAGVLQTQGFHILSTGNATSNVYRQTYVIYRSDRILAQLVAQYFQPDTKIVPSNGFYTFRTDVLVIVGKDWNLSKVPAAQIQTQ
jgi:LCP family protein required for cell wall assembly